MKIMVILCIIALLAFAVNYYCLTSIKKTEYTIDTDKNIGKSKEIVVLADLHDTIYGNNNDKLLKLVNSYKDAIVVIAGDMITGKATADWSNTMKFVIEITKNHKVFYVNGNHECRVRDYPEKYRANYELYRKSLTAAGVTFLENTHILYDNIQLYGLEIDEKYYDKFKRQTISIDEINSNIGERDENNFSILIAHNPRYIDDYVKWKPDLIVSGHFHGGIVRIPFVGGVMSPQVDIFPKYDGGIYNVDGCKAIVSRGTGTHTLKLRLFNRPEIIKIKLQNNH